MKIVRNAQKFLKSETQEREELRGHEHNLRFHLAMAVTCAALATGNPNPEQLAVLKTNLITGEMLREWTGRVWSLYSELGAIDNVAKARI